jgi:hypothetical protein
LAIYYNTSLPNTKAKIKIIRRVTTATVTTIPAAMRADKRNESRATRKVLIDSSVMIGGSALIICGGDVGYVLLSSLFINLIASSAVIVCILFYFGYLFFYVKAIDRI